MSTLIKENSFYVVATSYGQFIPVFKFPGKGLFHLPSLSKEKYAQFILDIILSLGGDQKMFEVSLTTKEEDKLEEELLSSGFYDSERRGFRPQNMLADAVMMHICGCPDAMVSRYVKKAILEV